MVKMVNRKKNNVLVLYANYFALHTKLLVCEIENLFHFEGMEGCMSWLCYVIDLDIDGLLYCLVCLFVQGDLLICGWDATSGMRKKILQILQYLLKTCTFALEYDRQTCRMATTVCLKNIKYFP
jgi:hypothetical protein